MVDENKFTDMPEVYLSEIAEGVIVCSTNDGQVKYHHNDKYEQLKARLEISDDHDYDGIDCRDETIKQLEKQIVALSENSESQKQTFDALLKKYDKVERQRDLLLTACKQGRDVLEEQLIGDDGVSFIEANDTYHEIKQAIKKCEA